MTPLPYRTLRPWLLATFGREVRRVALDAGSTCPNRDGTKGFGGCTYCDVEGSGTGALKTGRELADQLAQGIARARHKGRAVDVIAYFQSYSNTYVATERLREVLSVVDPWIGSRVVAVSVATRPDTFPPAAVEVLAELARRIPVWVEFGLEAADDAVLAAIRRMHTVEEFRDACARAHAAGLFVVGHAILGLPGDGREGARRTARELARARVGGVKVHNLMILRRTQLEKAWRAGSVDVLDAATYVQWLADFVEELAPEQVLHRITGDAPLEQRLAPRWELEKNSIHDLLATELARRGTRQGSRSVAGRAD
ncbi:MAG: TIGR01212 family radical SAM protein [Planctomycetes bacterium]|nr:TIGR01212 family radical SAM protein [Planctomycetota bacterium]